ncbi:hypothetical protein [Roseovarius sp. TE539]|nr:hypothetical protein [Roseovarius sp. TE539]
MIRQPPWNDGPVIFTAAIGAARLKAHHRALPAPRSPPRLLAAPFRA